MLAQVRELIRKATMVVPGDRVIVAVSGGPDSTALLHLLHRLSGELSISLHVFHMDHGLRGKASDEDAAYVEQMTKRLGVPCTVARLEPGFLLRQPGSTEENARAARYRELRSLARRIGATRVALGHNRDDQAETVLMRFLRGAGLRGLSGIPVVRTEEGLTYIRPLLETPRCEIEDYCSEHELFPRLDESNLTPDYFRNRIRLQLLPLLAETYNPAIAANLAQTAEVLGEDDRYLDSLAAQQLSVCRIPHAEGIALSANVLHSEPLALARRIVRLAAREAAGAAFDLGLEPVTRILDAASNPEGTSSLDLPGGIRVTIEYDAIRFEGPQTGPGDIATDSEDPGVPHEWPLTLSGETILPDVGLRITADILDRAFAAASTDQGAPGSANWPPSGPFEAAFDLERLPGPLSVRFRHPGDRLWPVGIDGSKKLQDLLVDAKVPRRTRDRVPLLVAGDEVLWAIGYRLDRRFLAALGSHKILLMRVFSLKSAL